MYREEGDYYGREVCECGDYERGACARCNAVSYYGGYDEADRDAAICNSLEADADKFEMYRFND